MHTINYFNIAVDVVGIPVLLMVLFDMLDRRQLQVPRIRSMIGVVVILVLSLASDLLESIWRGDPEHYVLLWICNEMGFITVDAMAIAFTGYFRAALNLEEKSFRWIHRFLLNLGAASLLLDLSNVFTGVLFSMDPVTGSYTRGEWFFLASVYPLLVMAFCALFALRRRSLRTRDKLPILCYCLLPMASGVVQTFFYGVSLSNIASLIAVLIIYFYGASIRRQELIQVEMNYQQAQTDLAMTQIQPHFLFNVISNIIALCDTDAGSAKEALTELSDYLHYKFTTPIGSYLVPLSEELDVTNAYLSLAGRRYGKRLRVNFQIQSKDMMLPRMTLQPIVENAVQHGVCKKEGGGTVSVQTLEIGGNYYLIVRDDGVGFDTSILNSAGKSSIGIRNVKTRIELICNGKLEIRSDPRKGGTEVMIRIPKDTKERKK